MKAGKLVFLFTLLSLILPANLRAAGSIKYANESILIHTDRDIYISGENMFFKLYVIDETTHKLSAISKTAYMVLRDSKSKPIANICVKITNGTAFGSIYLNDTISTGPYQLVAFTSWIRNQGEASFCYKQVLIANLFDKSLSSLSSGESPEQGGARQIHSGKTLPGNPLLLVTTDKTGYQKNEKVILKLALKNPDPDLVSTLSVSVNEIFPKEDLTGENIIKPGDLKSDPTVTTPLKISYLPEIKGRIIRGKVIDQQTNKAESNCKVLLSAIDTVANLQYTEPDSSGFFQFLLNEYYSNKEFIVSILDKPPDKLLSIIVEDPFKIDSLFHPLMSYDIENLKPFVKTSQDIVYIQKNYSLEPKIRVEKLPESPIAVPLIYYKPSSTVYPSDFVPLPDFTEISRELLPTVKIRKTDNDYSLELIDLKRQGFFADKPALFLNGVKIDNSKQIIPLASNQVKRIEVVNFEAVKGSLIFKGGILAVFTSGKDIPNMQLDPEALHKIIEPYMPVSSLVTSPKQEHPSEDNPDFRQLLYWNPDIAISGSGTRELEFFTSAHTGKYRITIEGVTSKGEIIHSTTDISIH
jgi:hypothetical protein